MYKKAFWKLTLSKLFCICLSECTTPFSIQAVVESSSLVNLTSLVMLSEKFLINIDKLN